MGAADSVPGVSGGTMALIVGIYERLLRSIGHGFRAIMALTRLDLRQVWKQLASVEWPFILPLVAGIGTVIVVAAGFVPDLLDRRPVESRALFLGLVAASLAVPWREIRDRTGTTVLVAAAAAIPAFVLSGLPPGSIEDPAPLVIFLGAAVAICAMILPGVSGAFLLLVLGLYEPTLRAVDERDFLYVAIFVVGMILGLGSFSLLLSRLLTRHHDTTMAALVGLMAGSLRALWPWQTADRGLLAPSDPLVAVVLAGVGMAVVTVIQVAGSRRRNRAPSTAPVG